MEITTQTPAGDLFAYQDQTSVSSLPQCVSLYHVHFTVE